MLLFGLGASAPLLLLGALSRQVLMRVHEHLLATGRAGKIALGALLIVTGAAVATGLDRRIETVLVEASPQWLTDLTTRF